MNKKAVHSLQIPVPKGITRWVDRSLAEICELVNGRGFKPYEWKRRGLPIIRIQNLNGSKDFNFYDGEFDEKILVEPGQLLFAWSGSRGASFGPHVWTGPKGVLNYHTWRVIPKSGTDRDFLFQLLEFETQNIEASSHGASALVHVQKWEIEKRIFGVPPLSEQRKIAEILRTWDEAIAKLEALRKVKRDHWTGLTQKLFGVGGEFPDKWEQRSLSAISTRVRRESGGGNHPVMTISAKSGYRLQSEKFSRDMAGNSVERYILLHEGEFAYNKGNSLTAPFGCIFPLEQPTALVPFIYFCFTLYEGFNREFFAHLFAAGALNRQLSRVINSGIRNDGLMNLDPEDFFRCRVPVPPAEEQTAIAATLTVAKQEIHLIEKMHRALVVQKRGLMQKLLTGKIRVAGALADLSPAAD